MQEIRQFTEQVLYAFFVYSLPQWQIRWKKKPTFYTKVKGSPTTRTSTTVQHKQWKRSLLKAQRAYTVRHFPQSSREE